MTSPQNTELPKTYDPGATERLWYSRWTEDGVFTASPDRAGQRDPFVVMMPPPNVTAILHAGHGLNNTVQDVLVRWRRMAGDEALWVPGTDHAGIATQNVVEKQLASEGSNRFELGRDDFVKRVESFVDRTGGEILDQLKAIGASADWTRTAYTFSPELSQAVRETFVRLYEDKLIYRGHRVIHWCTRCGTSLSDEEAEFHESNGKLYHLKYPVVDEPNQSITVATTRPETMLGDVAVAVNPDDDRYKSLIGKELLLPLANIRIPIVADSYTDPTFGTGAVKITPAHDANDFEVGKRHKLPMPVIIDREGIVREVDDAQGRVPAELSGLERFEARKRIVAMLEAQGVLVKTDSHPHSVRRCYRCDTVVEPRLSDQWFVRMEPLAKSALDVLRNGELRILPERWEAVYVNWLEGIRDWNISRQIWWGHRVPVWYCTKCSREPIASRTDVTACPDCGSEVRQDEDVLDTWFSSWLWPFSTLGWPNESAKDLKAFYPGDVLVTAPEILFFWVARMVMAGSKFMNETPFHTVYLHGTVRDMQHRKMSKSLGNGIDPLDVVKLYGADSLRWTMVAGLGLGVDVMLDPNDLDKSFSPGRNFCTKLWNMSRFLLISVGDAPVRSIQSISVNELTSADVWILNRLNVAIDDCNSALGPPRPAHNRKWTDAERTRGLRLSEYAESARRFAWNELADWYLESVKPRLAVQGNDREVARAVLAYVFDGALRLLHPIVPFITEELWHRLPQADNSGYLTTASWPTVYNVASNAGESFELVREIVQAIRQVRSDYNVNPAARVDAVLVSSTPTTLSTSLGDSNLQTIGSIARTQLVIAASPPSDASAQAVLSQGLELFVPLAGIVDLSRERARVADELASLEKQLAALQGRLANEKFTAKAPAAVVEAERAKAAEWSSRRDALQARLATFGD